MFGASPISTKQFQMLESEAAEFTQPREIAFSQFHYIGINVDADGARGSGRSLNMEQQIARTDEWIDHIGNSDACQGKRLRHALGQKFGVRVSRDLDCGSPENSSSQQVPGDRMQSKKAQVVRVSCKLPAGAPDFPVCEPLSIPGRIQEAQARGKIAGRFSLCGPFDCVSVHLRDITPCLRRPA